MQIMVGHPDAHGAVFLSEELPAGDGVAVFVPNPFAQAELDDTEEQGRNTEPKNTIPIALAVEEDEMDGLAQRQEKRDGPEIERQSFVTAQESVGFGQTEL